MKLKVAIIMPLAEQKGGGEKRLWDLMLEGRNYGIEWLLIFQEDGPLATQIHQLGVDVRVVPCGRLSRPHHFISALVKILALVRNERPDIILSWMWKAHFYGSPVALINGIPCLWSQLEVPDDLLLKRIAALLPASGVFINSKSGRATLEKLCPRQPIKLVYPGVSLNQFNCSTLPPPSEARRKLGLPLEDPIIGIVGRLQRWKGMHVLVEAISQVRERYPDIHCLIVGGKHNLEPNYASYLEEKITLLELENQVILADHQENIPEWMQAMDIFVHASDNEPFGIVIVEAMALGKPVVATDTGGPTDIISDRVNGLLTPYGNSEKLVNAILRYLDEPEFANSISLAAKKRAENFSTQHYVDNFIGGIFDFISKVS